MRDQADKFKARGLNVAAVSFDSQGVLEHFAGRVGIDYPLLSDPGSEVIRAFGILNDTVPADNRNYGIPFPGYYVVDENGVVRVEALRRQLPRAVHGGEHPCPGIRGLG